MPTPHCYGKATVFSDGSSVCRSCSYRTSCRSSIHRTGGVPQSSAYARVQPQAPPPAVGAFTPPSFPTAPAAPPPAPPTAPQPGTFASRWGTAPATPVPATPTAPPSPAVPVAPAVAPPDQVVYDHRQIAHYPASPELSFLEVTFHNALLEGLTGFTGELHRATQAAPRLRYPPYRP